MGEASRLDAFSGYPFSEASTASWLRKMLPGSRLIDLSTEADWLGEITEFGFLVAGENGENVIIGNVSLVPDSLEIRLQLAWKAWASFERWPQQSINFL